MRFTGLNSEEVKSLLERYGKNEIQLEKKINPFKIFIDQFKSSLILILILSAIALGVVGFATKTDNFLDVVLIISIVLISGISSFVQDYKAEKSIHALQEMLIPKSKVIRDGRVTIISSNEVVPGDYIVLESGDVVPADAVLVEATNIQINESTLTGESVPVYKEIGKEIYMNTYVSSGHAIAKTSSTGMKTKIGQIASKLQSIKEEKTHFMKQMDKLGKNLSWIVFGMILVIVIANLFKDSLLNSVLTAVALAVAAIPEGMPAVIVLSLVAGSKVMVHKNALVRKLSTIETIGSVNFICTDKTGTITKNEMSVKRIYANREEYTNETIDKEKVSELLLCNILNNNTSEIFDKEAKLIGDETEIALRNFSSSLGYDKVKTDMKYKRIYEVPFDSKRKMMSVVVKKGSENLLYTKGAPEKMLDKCTKILINGRVLTLTRHERRLVYDINSKLASEGLRVLGFAYKPLKKMEKNEEALEKDLIFLGLEGLIDPPNEGVKCAIEECKTAGVNVIMLTGDNPLTAKAIASEVGIDTTKVLISKDLEGLTDKSLYKEIIGGCRVLARLTPEEKLRVMNVLKDNQNIVAMTGDGVNDALALKKADVGIAMGKRGTDVAKESSDIILVDDNFSTIVSAIREGRRVFDNIRKFTNYLLTCNLAEVFIVFVATLFLSLKEPILLPAQLLWINLLTDGFPALALGMDPARRRIMQEPPRKKSEPIINKKLSWTIGLTSVLLTVLLLAVFFITLGITGNEKMATTAVFTGFVLFEFLRIAVIKREEKSAWISNKFLLVSLLVSVFLQVAVVYTPLNSVFGVVPLDSNIWGVILGIGVIGYFVSILFSKALSKKFD